MDRLTPTQRSKLMARVRAKNTIPELIVRRLVFSLGYRYRLHLSGLPGKPDLVFASRRKIIFVHGCFWHGHTCKRGVRPTTNMDFWNAKLQRNRERDSENIRTLRRNRWRVLVIWECCCTGNTQKLSRRIRAFLD